MDSPRARAVDDIIIEWISWILGPVAVGIPFFYFYVWPFLF